VSRQKWPHEHTASADAETCYARSRDGKDGKQPRNKNKTWKFAGPKKLSQTPYLHCSEERFSVRSLSAAPTSDKSDCNRSKTHATCKNEMPAFKAPYAAFTAVQVNDTDHYDIECYVSMLHWHAFRERQTYCKNCCGRTPENSNRLRRPAITVDPNPCQGSCCRYPCKC